MKGEGNQLDFGARVYDSRVGVWLSVDPLQAKYPNVTPYHFAAGNPVNFIDVDGRDIIRFTKTTTAFPRTQVSDGFYIGGGSSEVNTVTRIKAPGKDVFFYDVVQKSFTAHGGLSTVYTKSTQFYPNDPGSAVGITQSASNNIPFAQVNDLDFISLAKISPQWLVNELVKKDPSYSNLNIARAGMKIEEGAKAAAGLALFIEAIPEISLVKKVPEPTTTLYRGINESHVAYGDAVKGITTPNGGAATPLEHNTVSTLNSPYTSWTTIREVAENFALRPRRLGLPGVVLEAEIPNSRLVVSPNTKQVQLFHLPGQPVVSETEVLVTGKVTGANVVPIKQP